MSISLDTVRTLLKHNPWDKIGNDADTKAQELQPCHAPNEDQKLNIRINHARIEAMLRPSEHPAASRMELDADKPDQHDSFKVVAKCVIDRKKQSWPDAEKQREDMEALFLSLK